MKYKIRIKKGSKRVKKENTGEQRQIYSIRKNKAYGASSVLIGLMGSAFLLSGLAPTVQAEENDAKPETKPADGSAVNGTNAPTIETDHLIIASQPKESEPKSESTPTGNPKSDVENAPTNVTYPLNSESPQPKEEPVNSTEGAKPAETGTTESKPGEETTPSKRAVSIVYKVRYVDRKSGNVVHEVTKTKTVETTEAKAKASVTEIGAELANDSQLENYYVPDGNPTTFTKEIVEGEDNVFVYEVEGFGEAETPKERTVALKYTVEYVDGKSGLVLASEEKEEKVSTTETVAKKEVTIQPSLATNEKLNGWSLAEGVAANQTITLSEGTVGKVTFKLQNSEGGKVRNKRKVEYPTSPVTGQPYLTLENQTEWYISKENMKFVGNGRDTYNIKYKIGFTNIAASDLELTQGAKDLGFSLDLAGGLITANLTPTKEKAGIYEVGFQSISHPEVKVSGEITIFAKKHIGFMVFTDDSEVPLYPNNVDEGIDLYDAGRTVGSVGDRYGAPYNEDKVDDSHGYYTPIIQNQSFTSPQVDGGVYDSERWSYGPVSPKENVVLDSIKIPTTPFGYFMRKRGQTVENATADTKRYYTMFPIFASLDRSTDYNNNKKGLTIKDFQVLSASAGVEAKLVDLSKDKAPDKGFYSNTVDFQTMPEYDSETGRLKDDQRNSVSRTPYYLQFTKLPQTAGNYSVKFKITDSEGLVKTFTMNFTTYENFNSSRRSYSDKGTYTYALTNADALFEPNEENVDKTTNKVTIPISNEKQILGKVVLNKDNAYLEADVFPAGITLEVDEKKRDMQGRPTVANVVKEKGRKVALGKYTFSVKAHDGHYQTGAPRSFEFEIIDAVNPIGHQRWKEGSVPNPISVSMENHSKITNIRVEASGGYAIFEGNLTNPNDPKIAIYGLKRTQETQTARVYVTFTDGAGQTRQTYTDFTYEIEPNTEADFSVTVTNSNQEIPEGGSWKPMVITTTGEDVKIKVDSTKLPKGTRVTDYIVDGTVVGKQIVGKGRYEGVYNVPILAVKGDRVKATAVSLKVTPGTFTVEPETAEVEVLSNNIKAVTTEENGEKVKTPVSSYGLQNAPDDAKVTYSSYSLGGSGLEISEDGTKITGTPTSKGEYTINATITRKGLNNQVRTTTTTYTINVIGLTPNLTINSADHPENAYTSQREPWKAPLGTEIQPIRIQHDPHSTLEVDSYSLPKGLSYSYDAATHTGTITGTPSEMTYGTSSIRVRANMEYRYVATGESSYIEKYIYIKVTPITSNLTIDNANQTFAADKQMDPITVSDFDNRATIDLKYAPDGVTYNRDTHQITGSPTSGVGEHKFYVRAIMPSSLGGSVTEKEIVLTVTKLEPTLTANPPSVDITAKDNIPTIGIRKDSFSTLSEPTVTIEGTRDDQPLSSVGLSYNSTDNTITGRPTIVGSHIIHLSTTLGRRYSGFYYGETKTLDIPLTVNRKEFDFIENQNRETKVLSPITPVKLNVPEGIEVSVSELPSGLRYDATNKRIEGIPDKVGTYTVTVTARPEGITGSDKTATVTIQVDKLEASIGIDRNNQNVQIGTEMTEVTIRPNEHASVFGTDPLLNAVSGTDAGIAESNVVNYFLGAYGLTYNPTTHTITGTPTKTGRIVFTFIARNSADLGGAEARETFALNVVESLSKIPVITEAQEGSNAVKGSGVVGATVTVTLPDGAVKTAEVATDGTWTVATTVPLVKGQSISARQKEVNKTESNDISATVVGNSGLVPSKEALVDAIVEEATTITGKGINGSTITVTSPDGTVKTTTVSEGTWSVTLDKAAVKGENILVTQTEANKATSPAVTATVVPKITKGDQGDPGATGPKGEQGEPGTPGAPGTDGFTPEISVTPNDDGSYTITITQPNGKEPISTTVKNGTNGTNGRDGRTPKVKLTPIYENPAHPRTRRTRSVDENREAQPTGKQIGVHITVYFDNNDNGTYDEGDELISEENIYDGVDGIDGRDGTNGTNGTNGRDGANGNDGTAGATGETGAAGRDGRDGKDILNGTENPGENQGKDGDTFVNTKTGDIFVKENGTWQPAGNIKGPKGDDGKDILNGKTNPTSETGKDGDKYVNTETGDIFVKENGTWKSAGNIKGPKGDKGENGINGTDGRDGTNGTNGTDGVAGATGAAGHDGRDGKDILNGTENPGENQGKDGDTFVNTKTGDVFVKENGTWKPAGNIKGPKGDDGKDILNGKTNPTSETGKDGDKYVNTETGDIFVKENGTWKSAGNIKGPKGDKGENGTNGTDGRDGTNGTNGTDGVAGATGAAGQDGRDGKDGQSPTVTVRENTDGSHTIVITNPNGNTIETTVRDGKSPTVTVRENTDGTHTITIENADGKTTTTTVRDGKNGQSPTVSIRNNNDGTHTVTIINPDGSKTEAVIKDGKDGKDGQSPTVSVTNNGNGTHTIIITSSDGKVTTTVIKDGKCGCNDKPGGSTPGEPTRENSTTPNPGAPTPGGSTTPNPGAPTPGGSTTPNPGAPTTGGSTRPNPNSAEDPEMPEPPVHELPEYPLEIPNTLENSTNPNPGGSTTPNPGAPTPGGTPDRNPGGEPGTNPGALTPGTTPNQPVNPPELSITVNEHPNGELPKTGTTTDHLSILLGSGILLTLYVSRKKEEQS